MGKLQVSRARRNALRLAPLVAVLVARSAHASPSERTCIIRGDHVKLTGLIVQTRAGSFDATILDAPVTAVAHGDSVELEVSGAIAFKATVKRKIWYAVKDGLFSESVLFTRNALLVADRAERGELIGRAVLEPGDIAKGADKEPEIFVSPVRVRCDLLTLDWGESADMDVAGDGTRWSARTGTSLMLHQQPDEHAPGVLIASPSCDSCIHVDGLMRRGEWRKVAVSECGVVTTGWVRSRFLAPLPDSLLIGSPVDDCSGHRLTVRETLYPETMRKRSVRLKAGTPIYWLGNGTEAVWATVSQEQVFQVRYTDGAAWAVLIDIPGVAVPTAFVRASALVFES